VSTFDTVAHRIARYRICLERDAERGIIRADAREVVDDCYRTLRALLESARIELEGAGAGAPGDDGFADHFVSGCGGLALRMYRSMYRESRVDRLHAQAGQIRAEGRDLMEHLWARIERAA